jgi:hypothetical protein
VRVLEEVVTVRYTDLLGHWHGRRGEADAGVILQKQRNRS